PICDIVRTLPYKQLSKEQLKEWVILDTFDMFSPQYDNPQTISTVKKWFEKHGATVTFAGYVQYVENQFATVIRAIKNN
ncbi:MAG: class I SAM-dependent methyltransferase, partial [Bacteroidia bacterium]|nr:class I SAM-dependent methyltransferase [Bacteroidia bacterium]